MYHFVLLKVICQDHIASKCQKHKHNSSSFITASPESVHHVLHIIVVIFTVFPLRTDWTGRRSLHRERRLPWCPLIYQGDWDTERNSVENRHWFWLMHTEKWNALPSTSEGSNSSKLEKQTWHGHVYQSEIIEIQGWEKNRGLFIFQILCATRWI